MKPLATWKGRIVSVSGHPTTSITSRSLATMIKRFGEAKVEAIVRGQWP